MQNDVLSQLVCSSFTCFSQAGAEMSLHFLACTNKCDRELARKLCWGRRGIEFGISICTAFARQSPCGLICGLFWKSFSQHHFLYCQRHNKYPRAEVAGFSPMQKPVLLTLSWHFDSNMQKRLSYIFFFLTSSPNRQVKAVMSHIHTR